MDNDALYRKICDLDLKLFELRLGISDRVWKIWLVMFLGFYLVALVALCGLCLIERAYLGSVGEMRHEITAMQSKAPPQAHVRSVP